MTNILAGIALFEVFHDVQYLSLVWIYNRNRVEKDSSIGGFMRFIFRRSGSLIGVYIGLVFAYGSLGIFKERVEVETIKRILTGVVAASGLLHFYYDGFIWKVRERADPRVSRLDWRNRLGRIGAVFPELAFARIEMGRGVCHPVWALFGSDKSRGPAPTWNKKAGWIVADLPVGAMPRFDYAALDGREHTVLMKPLSNSASV